jgi:hypothetical protein
MDAPIDANARALLYFLATLMKFSDLEWQLVNKIWSYSGHSLREVRTAFPLEQQILNYFQLANSPLKRIAPQN